MPGYYGLAPGSWAHFARVWGEDLAWLRGRFAMTKDAEGKDKPMMNEVGSPVSRWIDGVLEAKENLKQTDNTKVMVFWGHAPGSQTRLPEMKTAMEKLEMLVVIDPYPTLSAVLSDRTDGVYLLPASTQYETIGLVTASSAMARTCWPRGPTRLGPKSRMAIRNSPMACWRSSAGTPI